MKKVLYIYYHFPPLQGDWRGLAFAGPLPEFGWQPTVIAASEGVQYQKDYSLLTRLPQGMEIFRVGHHEPPPLWQFARNKLKINFDFPDYYKSWYSPTLSTARDIIRKEKIELIFTSSPPYTSALVALQLKKEFDIPWVADWRDLWSGNEFLNLSYAQSVIGPLRRFLKYRIRKAEYEILQAAYKCIVVCQYQKDQFLGLHSIDREKIEIITNGYEESDFETLKPYPLFQDKPTIVFLGSFYPDYKEQITKFLTMTNEVDKDVEVVFIGSGAAEMQHITVSNLTRILHLAKNKALSFAAGSDFLFLVMPPYAKWTLLKMYEYMRLGKPILALVPKDSDPARMIKEAKAGFIISYDTEEMKIQLKTIFSDWRQGKFKNFQPDWEYIAQFEHKNLTRKLANVFNEAVSPK